MFFLAESHTRPELIGSQRWRVPVASEAIGGWAPLSIAYSPLWIARAGGMAVAVRRSDLGLVEVAIPPGTTEVEMEHRPGAAEWAGVGLSVLSVPLLASIGVRRART